jgi:hypothetical protein
MLSHLLLVHALHQRPRYTHRHRFEIAVVIPPLVFEHPPHSLTLNDGCNEWNVEPVAEVGTDGAPCQYPLP